MSEPTRTEANLEQELAGSTEKDDEEYLLPAADPEFENEAPQPEDQP